MFIFDQLLSYSPGIGGGVYPPVGPSLQLKGGRNFQNLKNDQIQKRLYNLLRFMAHGMSTQLVPPPIYKRKKIQKSPPPSLGEWALVLKPHSVHENGRRDWYSFFFLVGPCYCRWSFLCDTWWLVASVHKMGSSHRPYSCTEWGLSNKAQTLRSRCPK